jgi:hypothetical protein
MRGLGGKGDPTTMVLNGETTKSCILDTADEGSWGARGSNKGGIPLHERGFPFGNPLGGHPF